jgi:hypothetical protein
MSELPMLAVEAPIPANEQPINLARHDEVVLMQPLISATAVRVIDGGAGVVCAEHHTRSQRLFSGPPGIDHIEVREDYPHISLY